MTKSAGILVYRYKDNFIEVLLAHPGGPFWAKKDNGAWSIPKGEFTESKDPLAAAKREFREEIGKPAPKGKLIELGDAKTKTGKTILVWAVEGNLTSGPVKSNMFMMEWPPKSGQQQEFPEVDRTEWFEISRAVDKLHSGQAIFLERLADKLDLPIEKSEQASLF